MAVPLTADQIVKALRDEGVKVVEVSGWRTNNRNRAGAWGPINGIMLHHTVTPKSMSAVPMCFNGIQNLPGPLCHGVIRRDGTVHLVGNGRANHAGGGDPDVLAAVIGETYGTRPPATNEHQGSPGAVDGNSRFYGFECENLGDGVDPWPAAQVEAMVRASAALARAHRWGAKSVIGHLEWSDWKSDPKGPDNVVAMPGLRLRIAERLLHPASWTPGTTPKPPTPTPIPPAGGTMTPRLTWLTRAEDLTLIPGSPLTLYWTSEPSDGPNQHGDGGSTFLQGATYTIALDLEFSGLDGHEYLSVRTLSIPTAGGTPVPGGAVEVDGRGDGTTLVKRTVTLTGRITTDARLAIEITAEGSTATLEYARVQGLSWAL
ncbi:MAG: hypothetical protein K0R62_6739 [Nonomuraea muscovyensis]|jgi:hypothetical protein|nr:hypothetical protein [Nonomuraea muscovyensis]